MFELTGFQRDLLFVIGSLSRPSGQDIKEHISTYVGEVNHGRLYPNLDTLVERDLVDKGEIDRRTNFYAISRRGREMLVERHEWEAEMLRRLESHDPSST